MKFAVIFGIIASLAAASGVESLAAEIAALGPEAAAGNTWVVLVAGSNGWTNYRHQADVCHAYQAIHTLGVPDERIITMMYDDIANHKSNPFPGKIYNEPEHKQEVYHGVPKDYTGKDVIPDTFVKVMTGVPTTVGSKRVLESTENDNVFLYFDDHGGPGIIAFPSGTLSAARLGEMLQTMYSKKMYKNLVFHMQACNSGSMFYKQKLPPNVYAATSAPVDASAFAYNYDDVLRTYTCSGWAYGWIYGVDTLSASATFQDNFDSTWQFVKNWSQPCQYGDEALRKHNVHQYFKGTSSERQGRRAPVVPPRLTDATPQHLVPYEIARRTLASNRNSADAVALFKQEQAVRDRVDSIVSRIVGAASAAPHLQTVPCDICNKECKCFQYCLYDLPSKACEFECCNEKSCFENAPKNDQTDALECAENLFAEFAARCASDQHAYWTSAAPYFTRLCKHSKADIAAAYEAIWRECP